MTKSSAAMVLVTGFFFLFGGASQAAPAVSARTSTDSAGKSADAVKDTKRKSTHHHAGKAAQTSSNDRNDRKETSSSVKGGKPPSNARMPPVASAEATALDTTAAAAKAMSARAIDNVQAAAENAPTAFEVGNRFATPDQIIDVDYALQQDNLSARKPGDAAIDAHPVQAPAIAAMSSERSFWDQTSLIGRIFVGFGALLTLASAARMLID